MGSGRVVLWIGIGILGCGSAPAQEKGPPSFAGQTAAREPQMVDLNVVVVDAHGQPVTDLSRDELRITDSGKPQTIAFFRHRDDALAAPPKLAPDEVSNRGRDNVPRATMILWDMLNQRFGTRGNSSYQLVHQLESLESPDYVYLYGIDLNGKLFAIHGMPGAGEPPPAAGSAPWTRQIKAIMDRVLHEHSQLRPVDDLDPVYRVEVTYATLNAAAAELARAPGRKNLVWVTDGVPITLPPEATIQHEALDFTPQLRQMCENFDRWGVSIYPVRQVMLGSPESMGGPGTTGMGSIDTLSEFAQLTGGRPDAGKDIGAAVRQAIADARTSYQVGYYPPEGNWDDKFHKLKVTSTRKNVRIEAKTGYYAWSEPAGARSEQAIAATSTTTFDASEIGLRLSAARDPLDTTVWHLKAHVDAHDVAFIRDGGQYKVELRYALLGIAYPGVASIGKMEAADLRFTEAQREQAMREGIALDCAIRPDTMISHLRLAVYDRESHAVGSVTIPLANVR
jgi:VWFA-related protein